MKPSIFALAIVLLSSGSAFATCDDLQVSVATTPVPEQSPGRLKRALQLRDLDAGETDTVVIGDSLAQHWSSFQSRDFPDGALNLGVGGDKTQELRWRLREMLPEGLSPTNVVLLIGTNNLSDPTASACGVAAGIKSMVDDIGGKWPDATIWLFPILPRGKKFDFRGSDRTAVNDELRSAYQGPTIRVVDVPEADLTCRSQASCDNYKKDRLHFTEEGYRVLRKAIRGL